MNENDPFFREYTSPDAILKYSRATAGTGISTLLDGEYKEIYLRALKLLPDEMRRAPMRMLEFGCGAGMNLVHLAAVLRREGFQIERAIGADFSPVLIATAQAEAEKYLTPAEQSGLQFCVGKNETLVEDLSAALGQSSSALENSFQFVFGVNTFRYCHRAGSQMDCARDVFRLLAPGGVCVMIDMNDRFPVFRSALRHKLAGQKVNEEECYLPSLHEYTDPFAQAGFDISRSENFCWIPHSAGSVLAGVLGAVSPILNLVARSRAMRSLVVAQKPVA